MTSTGRVAIISRVPREGQTKRRLAHTVGDAAATRLHEAFLHDELRAITDAGFQPMIVHDPPRSDAEVAALDGIAGGAHRVALPGHDLASDLLAGFRALCSDGPVAVVSADSPHLGPGELTRAFELLDTVDIVLGPCPDGGYWLIAMREPHDVFTGVEMGTSGVLEATRRRAEALGLRIATVGALDDVDTFDDLCLAAPYLRRDGRSRRVLAALMAERPDLAPPLPRRLHIELTNRCNSFCATCYRTADPKPDRDMTLAEATSVLDQFPTLESVALQVNGEPLLYPDLVPVIELAKARGVYVELNSNGVAVRRKRRERLLDSGLDRLHISVDAATPETYARVRGVDAFDIIERNLENLAAARRRREQAPSVVLWMTANRHNLCELPGLVELAARVDAEAVFLQRMVFFGEGLATSENSLHGPLAQEHEDALIAAAERAEALGVRLGASGGHSPREMLAGTDDDAPWRDCRRTWESAVVMADGQAVACCLGTFHTPLEQIAMGPAFDGQFAATWRGDRYRALRIGLLTGEGAEFCRRCGLDWSL